MHAPNTLNLVADIGGTNARFQLVDTDGPMADVCELVTADFDTMEDAMAAAAEGCKVVGVTTLTSMDGSDLTATGV